MKITIRPSGKSIGKGTTLITIPTIVFGFKNLNAGKKVHCKGIGSSLEITNRYKINKIGIKLIKL